MPVFSLAEFWRLLVRWVVCDNQAFEVVENANFRSLLMLLKPDINVPSATTIKGEVMKCYGEGANRLGALLRHADCKISLTSDCWTSPNTKAFMAITVHFIDDDWVLRSLVSDFIHLGGSHSGEDLCAAFAASCDRFGVLDKILAITTDNASNIGRSLVLLERACHQNGIVFEEKEQHVRCMAHVINLAVQALLCKLDAEVADRKFDGAAVEETPDDDAVEEASDDGCSLDGDATMEASDDDCSLDDDAVQEASDDGPSLDGDVAMEASGLPCIAKLRLFVKKARFTPQRRVAFKGHCQACGTKPKQLILDTPTRWNSTHAMIKRARDLRGPLISIRALHRSIRVI
jgi:hypothetical protein